MGGGAARRTPVEICGDLGWVGSRFESSSSMRDALKAVFTSTARAAAVNGGVFLHQDALPVVGAAGCSPEATASDKGETHACGVLLESSMATTPDNRHRDSVLGFCASGTYWHGSLCHRNSHGALPSRCRESPRYREALIRTAAVSVLVRHSCGPRVLFPADKLQTVSSGHRVQGSQGVHEQEEAANVVSY
jgi:hypothetical protein